MNESKSGLGHAHGYVLGQKIININVNNLQFHSIFLSRERPNGPRGNLPDWLSLITTAGITLHD